MKTLESKETRAQGNDADNAQFSLCYRLNAVLPTRDGIFLFRALARFVEERPRNSVKHFVRGTIIRSITLEEYQVFRRFQAIEGYVDLGMFEEANAELRELDPAWFAFRQTLQLQLRVLAGLSQCH